MGIAMALDASAFSGSGFDARAWVDRVLVEARHGRGASDVQDTSGRTRTGFAEEQDRRELELQLQVHRDEAYTKLSRCWQDLRARLPRASREARRVADLSAVHAARLRPPSPPPGPSSALRLARRRARAVERVRSTLDAAHDLRLALEGASVALSTASRSQADVQACVASEEEEDLMDQARRVRSMRRALRATRDVSGFEDAHVRVSRYATSVLARCERDVRRAVSLRRPSEVRRVQRAARTCGGSHLVPSLVAQDVARRAAREAVSAWDAHARAIVGMPSTTSSKGKGKGGPSDQGSLSIGDVHRVYPRVVKAWMDALVRDRDVLVAPSLVRPREARRAMVEACLRSWEETEKNRPRIAAWGPRAEEEDLEAALGALDRALLTLAPSSAAHGPEGPQDVYRRGPGDGDDDDGDDGAEEEEDEDEDEGEEDEGEGGGGEVDWDEVAWTVARPLSEAMRGWDRQEVQVAEEAMEAKVQADVEERGGASHASEALRRRAEEAEEAWTWTATTWFQGARRRCACATDLADVQGLVRVADEATERLAIRHRELARKWRTGRVEGDKHEGWRRGARDAAPALLLALVRAAACLEEIQQQCSLARRQARAMERIPDETHALVRADGTLDRAQLWRRAGTDGITKEDRDPGLSPTVAPYLGDATLEGREGPKEDGPEATLMLPRTREALDRLARDTEEAFVVAVGAPAVERMRGTCVTPFRSAATASCSAGNEAARRVGAEEAGGCKNDAHEEPWSTFSASPQECVAAAGEDLLRVPELIQDVEECVAHYRRCRGQLKAKTSALSAHQGDAEDAEGIALADLKGIQALPWLEEAARENVRGAEDGEGGELVASWSAKVAGHVAREYARELLQGVARLSREGEAQLQADLEYFLNVVAALAAEAPASLITLRDCVAMEPAVLQELLQRKEDGEEESDQEPVDVEAVGVILRAKERGARPSA